MKPKTNKYFEQLMKYLPAMDGWRREDGTDDFYGHAGLISHRKVTLVCESRSIKIEIIACEVLASEKVDRWCIIGSGHVKFAKNAGEPLTGALYSFDRTGVEDSFYLEATDTPDNFKENIARQIERVQQQRTYWETAISVPDIPFTVAPDGVEQLKIRIQRGEPIYFTPSGFGTGYILTIQPSRYATRGSKTLSEFFNVPQVYIQTFDAD